MFKKIWEMLFGKKETPAEAEQAEASGAEGASKDAEGEKASAEASAPSNASAEATAKASEDAGAKKSAESKADDSKAAEGEAKKADAAEASSKEAELPPSEQPKLVVEHPNFDPNNKSTTQLSREEIRKLTAQASGEKSNYSELPETVQLNKGAVKAILEQYKKEEAAKAKISEKASKKENLAGAPQAKKTENLATSQKASKKENLAGK